MENQLKMLNNIAKQLKAKSDIRNKNIDNLLNWKKIENYDNYSVSNRGEVRNDRTGKLLKGSLDSGGYKRVILRKEGIIKSHSIHKLAANAFIKNPQNKQCVDHINNNRIDNNFGNLRYATFQENNRNRNLTAKNTSTVKGVFFTKSTKKWRAQISINKKIIHLGYFHTLEEAKEARQQKAKQLFGDFTNKCEQY